MSAADTAIDTAAIDSPPKVFKFLVVVDDTPECRNAVRFGGFLEFGHQLSLTTITPNIFILRFEAPFQDSGAVIAARELLAALFGQPTQNYYEFFRPGIHPGFAEALRFREFYFPFLGPGALLALAIGWLAGMLAFARGHGPAGARRAV
ncbi:MAG: hypothetical protein R3360_03885, partial [Alphaproteobacteria bacterium]|nr:hypothetical protein [Alphaproteobacteria bacterium]